MKLATAIANFASCALAAFLAVSCTVKEPLQDRAPETSEPVFSMAPRTLTLQLDDALVEELETGTKAPGFLEALGVKSLRRVFPDAGEFEPRSRKMGLHRFYRAELLDGTPPTKAAGAVSAHPGVISADIDRPIRKRISFNDPYYRYQWDLSGSSSEAADIHVTEVWDQYTTGSSRVIVSVVDESVDPTHPDLNYWTDDSGHTGYNFVKENWDLSICPVWEGGENIGDNGHGTHIAGIISAINNNRSHSSGMAGGNAAARVRGVRIQSCSIFSGGESVDGDAAIKWGADHGAVISQNSWGFVADDNEDGTISAEEMEDFRQESIPEALKAAIDYFITYAGCDASGEQLPDSPMKGGLVFFAAGNDDIDYDPICAYEPVISVGSFRETGARSSFSNWGDWVDIAAPGGEGTTDDNYIWNLYPISLFDEGFAGMVGTSMACPHASGAAALVVSYFGGPGFTADDCRNILFDGLDDVVGGSKPVGRKLNVYKAFRNAIPNRPPEVRGELEDLVIEGLQHRGTVRLDEVFYDEDGEQLSYDVSIDDESVVSSSVTGDNLHFSPKGYGITSYTVTAMDFLGESVQAQGRLAVVDQKYPVKVRPEVATTEAWVYVSSPERQTFRLCLYNPAGAKVYERESQASVFEPIRLDTSEIAPGRYTLVVTYGGETKSLALVKY